MIRNSYGSKVLFQIPINIVIIGTLHCLKLTRTHWPMAPKTVMAKFVRLLAASPVKFVRFPDQMSGTFFFIRHTSTGPYGLKMASESKQI